MQPSINRLHILQLVKDETLTQTGHLGSLWEH